MRHRVPPRRRLVLDDHRAADPIGIQDAALVHFGPVVILGIDQNYSQIIKGAAIIIAVSFEKLSYPIAKRRLARAAAH